MKETLVTSKKLHQLSTPDGASKVVVQHIGLNVYRAQEVLGLLLTVS